MARSASGSTVAEEMARWSPAKPTITTDPSADQPLQYWATARPKYAARTCVSRDPRGSPGHLTLSFDPSARRPGFLLPGCFSVDC